MSRWLPLVALAVLLPARADAHLNSTGMGPLYDGAMHFLGSPGDLLTATSLALFAGLRGPDCARRVLFVLPGTWLAGALAGLLAPALPETPWVSAVWVLGLGAMLALDVKLPLRPVAGLAACAGLWHGFMNGCGLGGSLPSLAALVGLAAAVFALVALAAGLVVALRVDWARIAVRVAGSWIAASGLLWLGWAARGALLLLILAAAPAIARAQTHVLGYVQNNRFHPLLVVEAAQIGPYEATRASLLGIARNAFEATGAEFPIQKEIETADPKTSEPVRYGVAPGRSDQNAFYELNRGAKPRRASPPTAELRQSFLRFFSDERIEDVRILYATDLDADDKQELWVVYRLEHGGIGRMVWEQRAVAGEWIELANHCFGCAD